MISLMRSRIQTMFLAWISMSLAVPRAPPSGWWIMMRAFSVADRRPGAGAQQERGSGGGEPDAARVSTFALSSWMVS
jgi:hypothetical protein